METYTATVQASKEVIEKALSEQMGYPAWVVPTKDKDTFLLSSYNMQKLADVFCAIGRIRHTLNK